MPEGGVEEAQVEQPSPAPPGEWKISRSSSDVCEIPNA